MKKILIAFNGTQFSTAAFEFARELNERQPVLLTAVFIPQVSYSNLWSYSIGAMTAPVFAPMIEQEDDDQLKENIERFQTLCVKNNIAFRVHKDFSDVALPELKHETRFADLLLLSSEKFFENMIGGMPGEYLKETVHDAECPVLILPENYTFPQRNIIAYDGSPSSVYALKQFAYLLPELSNNDTLLVYSKDENNLRLPDEEFVEELATQHYKNLTLLKLQLESKKFFNTWLQETENPILICGSMGRSIFSQMFRKSFVSEIIADHNMPVFIAHT